MLQNEGPTLYHLNEEPRPSTKFKSFLSTQSTIGLSPKIISRGTYCAICDFPRREDELMTELMNGKRSTS
jgi:hypothetical protein